MDYILYFWHLSASVVSFYAVASMTDVCNNDSTASFYRCALSHTNERLRRWLLNTHLVCWGPRRIVTVVFERLINLLTYFIKGRFLKSVQHFMDGRQFLPSLRYWNWADLEFSFSLFYLFLHLAVAACRLVFTLWYMYTIQLYGIHAKTTCMCSVQATVNMYVMPDGVHVRRTCIIV